MSNERDTNRLHGVDTKFFGSGCPRCSADGCTEGRVAECFNTSDELQSCIKSGAHGATIDGAFEFGIQ